MSAVCFLDGVHRKESNCVDAKLIEIRLTGHCGLSLKKLAIAFPFKKPHDYMQVIVVSPPHYANFSVMRFRETLRSCKMQSPLLSMAAPSLFTPQSPPGGCMLVCAGMYTAVALFMAIWSSKRRDLVRGQLRHSNA
jgi:hypothetical protein